MDPGPNFVISDEVFNADFYYCHVEPEFIVAKRCGPGDPSKGDAANSCHFSSVVTAMQLRDHPAVDCAGGDHPVDPTQVGAGSAAQADFDLVSSEMSRDYMNAPLYRRPVGYNHPRPIFDGSDPQVLLLLSQWAMR